MKVPLADLAQSYSAVHLPSAHRVRVFSGRLVIYVCLGRGTVGGGARRACGANR